MDKKKSRADEVDGPHGGEGAFTADKLEHAASRAVIANGKELVNDELMIKRLRDGDEISCTFVSFGRHIHCAVSARKYAIQELCTCDAPYFCRHAAALVLTYLQHPDTFLDLEEFLDGLENRPQAELVEMLRRMIGRYPASSLEVLGLAGFQVAEVLDDLQGDDLAFEDSDDDFLAEFPGDDLDNLDLDDEDEEGFDDEPGPQGPRSMN